MKKKAKRNEKGKMKIIAIKQLKSGKNVFFILDTYEEFTLDELIPLVRKNKIKNIQTVCSKVGTIYLRSKANRAKKDNLDKIAITCNENDFLLFNGKHLFLKTKNGRIKRKWKAISGILGSTPKDQYKKDYGPLPEGRYEVQFDKTLDYQNSKNLWDKFKWIIKSPSWGWIITPLKPHKNNKMNGRGNLYIHGGSSPGSEGCIDLTNANKDFHVLLRLYNRNFNLIVKY